MNPMIESYSAFSHELFRRFRYNWPTDSAYWWNVQREGGDTMRKLKPGEKRCKRCDGAGGKTIQRHDGTRFIEVRERCPTCKGSGVQPNHEHAALKGV